MKSHSFCIFIAIFAAFSIGCSHTEPRSRKISLQVSSSSWKNFYKGDERLAGIEINQYTGNSHVGKYTLDDYNEGHPAEIIYYFWNGYIQRFIFSPNGSIIYKEKSKIPLPAGSAELDFIDFSYGSDPTFSRHPDPRRKVQAWTNLYHNDSSLAGIEIDQRPREGCVYEDRSRYDGRHPAQTDYYFWDGRRRYISYSPYGDIWSDNWSNDKIKPGDPFWKDVDFSYGSDPSFKRHEDPRQK